MFFSASLFLLQLPLLAFALSAGTYSSRNGGTAALELQERGTGFSLHSCANYENLGCAAFSLDLYRISDHWQGEGSLVAAYRGDQSFDCPYEMEATISENAKGELFLSLHIPRTMLPYASRCPSIQELGGQQWFSLLYPYIQKKIAPTTAHN